MRPLLIALLLLPSTARAAEPMLPAAAAEPDADGPTDPTPPDVLAGERYDGRAAEPLPRDFGRALARALLWPPRMLVRGIGGVARPAMEWNERDHVQQRVTQALTSDDGLLGVRPVINYEADFTPSFGLLFFDNRLPDHMRSSVSSAFGGPSVLANDARLAIPLGAHMELALHADYSRRNDELYTGIGMHSPLPFSRYAFDRVDATAELQYRPLHALQLDAGSDLGWRRFSNGTAYAGDQPIAGVYCERGLGARCAGPVDERLVPGYAAGTQLVRVHGAAHVDGRADELSSGLVADARVDYTHGLGSDESSYLRLHGHIGRSFEIWQRRTIYVGVSGDDEVAFGNTPIPFSELVQLGGIDDLRGFRRARFRDASSLLGSLEYRWPIWMWMDGSLFVDYGGVFKPQFANFAVRDLRPDVGIGLRMHSTDKYSLRVQVAYGFGGGGGGGIRLVFAGNGNPS
jgi:hypothetical protein